MFCGACGEDLLPNSKFCANCGSAADVISNPVTSANVETRETSSYQRPSTPAKMPLDQYKERTGWLSFVIVMNYIGLVLLIILGIMSIFLSFVLGVFLLLMAWFNYWLIQGLKIYDGTRRGIVVVLLIIGIITSLIDFDFFALIIGGLEIYALVFHAPTVRLFE
ncbi:MAG: hypothetical protein GPJ54_14840 [Candidatus Heimdallarchaeota archaeon]|nr:hypothetical protein [Candidatus Heimdallarchaeota archaeon]